MGLAQRIFISFVFCCLLAGCATTHHQNGAAQKGLVVSEIVRKYDLDWNWNGIDHVMTLDMPQGAVKLMADSQIVVSGYDEVLLDAPVKMKNSQLIVPYDFKEKVLDKTSLMPKKHQVKTPVITKPKRLVMLKEIVLDAGHGGKDPGAIGRGGLQEKEVVLDVTKRLRKHLVRRGLIVHMTRKDDTFISLEKRTEIVSKTDAQLFVSIHANANRVRRVNGLEVYALKPLTDLEKHESQRLRNQYLMYKRLSLKRKDHNVAEIVSDMLYSYKQEQAKDLAQVICENTTNKIRAKNLGVKQARFYVLRNTLVPAVLVEIGFLSNPREEKLLGDSAYREKIAEGIAQSVLEYAGM